MPREKKMGKFTKVEKFVMGLCMFNRDAKNYCPGALMKISTALEVVALNVLTVENPT